MIEEAKITFDPFIEIKLVEREPDMWPYDYFGQMNMKTGEDGMVRITNCCEGSAYRDHRMKDGLFELNMNEKNGILYGRLIDN